MSHRSEIEQHLISQLVLACGDVSLVSFLKFSRDAIAASREALSSSCQIVVDTQTVAAALDQTRLFHLGCRIETLIDNPHITTATEAELAFWQHPEWRSKLSQVSKGCILVVGYAPSVLVEVCEAMSTVVTEPLVPNYTEGRLLSAVEATSRSAGYAYANQKIQPALVIGMPIGFSHAPAAKRKLMQQGIPFITVEGTLGGGALAATALNALVESLIDKPDCHCYLKNV